MSRAISLQEVTKVYGRGVTAVNRLSLEVDPGEFVVLLGPSGCGKSTVLRLIAGLEEPTSGTILLDGEDADELAPGERQLAMVFQHYALYPTMTGRENIGFPLRIEAPDEDPTARVEEAARVLGVQDLLDRLPAHLSGGEQQRIAMGRAIVRRPSTFLMDEPLSNLDAKLRNRLRAEIATLTRQLGVTTLYVTHDQAEAMSLGDRVAVMRDGVIQQTGTAREVYQLPNHVFVAAFVGTPRINLLKARVLAPLGGRMSIDFGSQKMLLPEPLTADHQMLRIQMGRDITVGLRSEAIRIGDQQQMRHSEGLLHGVVDHVEFQGHESLVHVNIGGTGADVAGLEAPRRPKEKRSSRQNPLFRLLGNRQPEGSVSTLEAPSESSSGEPAADPASRMAGNLVLRAGAETQPRPGDRVPLLLDLEQLYVFDARGDRVCPAPANAPALGPY